MNTYDYKSDNYVYPVVQRAKTLLEEEAQIEVGSITSKEILTQFVNPQHITSMIAIGGDVNMYVAISYEKTVITKLIKLFIYDEVNENELEELSEATASEISNTIVGNSISSMPYASQKLIRISTPVTIKNSDLSVIKRNHKMYEITLLSELGNIIIYIIKVLDSDVLEDILKL
ncbi:MAG: hypothetical protein GQ570_08720 [Helicobacteraceae bacterium]|nr:hypothetical protein [Helicobacteraceae bacterium]